MTGLLVLHGLLLEHDLHRVGLQVGVSDIDSVLLSLSLDSGEESVGALSFSAKSDRGSLAGGSGVSGHKPVILVGSLSAESDPRNLLTLRDFLGLSGLHLNSELLVGDAVESSHVDLALPLGGNLGQHDWSGLELGLVVDFVVLSVSGGEASFDDSTVLQGMDTLLNNHVRYDLGVMILLLVGVLLDGELERGSSDILHSHGDRLATVKTEWTEDHDRSIELASDRNLEPLGGHAFLELVISKFNYSLIRNGCKHSVFVEILGGEGFPFSAVDLELPSSLAITTTFGTVKFKNMVALVQGNFKVELS
jgi:hypothetical protein